MHFEIWYRLIFTCDCPAGTWAERGLDPFFHTRLDVPAYFESTKGIMTSFLKV